MHMQAKRLFYLRCHLFSLLEQIPYNMVLMIRARPFIVKTSIYKSMYTPNNNSSYVFL